jgi:hypothetical protein
MPQVTQINKLIKLKIRKTLKYKWLYSYLNEGLSADSRSKKNNGGYNMNNFGY